MKLAGDFEFEAPVAEVWKALLDPVVLAAAMPGCDRLDLEGDTFVGQLNVKVGPVQGKFEGKVKLSDVSEEKGYTIDIDGRGSQGFVKATASISLTKHGDRETRIDYDADVRVGGRIASVGQRLIEASAKAIIKESLAGLNTNVKARANAGEGQNAEVVQASQTDFTRKVAQEVAKDLIPTPVRYGLVGLALVGLIALVLYFTR